jgi:hypothetical protein
LLPNGKSRGGRRLAGSASSMIRPRL